MSDGRRIAFDVLRRVEEGGAYASRALDAALESAGVSDARESGLATELVYGTLRRALALDAVLQRLSKRPLSELDPGARIAMRMGAYQLLFLKMAPHAAVGEAVTLVKSVDHGRAVGFVNAVLRSLSRSMAKGDPLAPDADADPIASLAIRHALPAWMAREWTEWLGLTEADALAAAMNEPAPLCLRSAQRERLLERLSAAGITARATRFSPEGLAIAGSSVREVVRAAGELRVSVQDEGAQLVSLFTSPRAGERVLDACAAPGGKAFHLAELVGATGEVVAVELHPRKAEALRNEAAARGVTNLRVICADAGKPISGLDLGSFDAVLVDAPCSGLGTLRRHPELKLRRVEADIERIAELQRAILSNCANYAKPAAAITYAVCTLTRAEGPRLAELPGFRRLPPPPNCPAEALNADGDLLTLPSRHGADGFYAKRLAKVPV
jgi:16S rRNA (cytosine967-C5)-methyltransferase